VFVNWSGRTPARLNIEIVYINSSQAKGAPKGPHASRLFSKDQRVSQTEIV
jgi:hypothetical protein